MADIRKELNQIKNAVYGREVRGSIHDGIDKVNRESEGSRQIANNTEQRQDAVEQQFNTLLGEWSDDKPIDNAETIAARTNTKESKTYENLGKRLDEEYGKVTRQLAETASDLIDRGINVLKPPKGLPIPKADGVIDDTQALQAISNYAKEKNLPIYMPDRDYLINGRLFFYTSVKCDGQIILHNDDVGHAVVISPTKPRIDLDVSLLSGMNEDSTKITGLPQNIRGATLIIQSNERLIKRNNVADPWYFKQDSFVVYDNEGTVFPPIDDTYTDLSKITEAYYREKEDKELIVDGLKFVYEGSVAGDREALLVNRSDTILNNPQVVNNSPFPIKKMFSVNNCANVVFNLPNGSGANYSGYGYGISIGNACFVTINDGIFTDCRHGVSGRHGKHVRINGGVYYDIDTHWGNDYKIAGAEIIGKVLYAGKDLRILDSEIHTDLSAIQLRSDTPELRGSLIVDGLKIHKKENPIINRLDVFYMNAVSVDEFDWERELRTPDLVSFKNIDVVDSDVTTNLITVGNNQFDQFHKQIRKMEFENITNDGGNNTRLGLTRAKTSYHIKPENDIEISFKDVQSLHLTMWDETGRTDNFLYDIQVENCKNVILEVEPSIISALTCINTHTRRVHPHNYDQPFVGDFNFITCHIVGVFRPVNYFKAFNCIFDVQTGDANPTDVLNALKIGKGNAITNRSILYGLEDYVNPSFYKTNE